MAPPIGEPSRSQAWLLARDRYLRDEPYNALLDVLKAQGYPVTRVLKVPQGTDFIGAPGFHGGQ